MSKAGYNPMSMKRLGGRTRHPRVSSSPSKIPYGGFSPVRLQTGIQRRRPSSTAPALSAEPAYVLAPPTYTPSPALHRTPMALSGKTAGPLVRTFPVQRPLARQRVMLSRQVYAYYGLMCASRRLPPIYGLDDGPLPYGSVRAAGERVPNLLCLSIPFVPPSVPRRSEAIAPDCCFIASTGLPHSRTGSAPAPHIDGSPSGFLTRLQSSLHAAARRACWPFTIKGVYVRAFTSQVTSKRCRI